MAGVATKIRSAAPAPVAVRLKKAKRRLPPSPPLVAKAHGRRALVRVGLAKPLGDGAAECPICGLETEAFLGFGIGQHSPRAADERRCPQCGSLERHRLLWLYLQRETNLFDEPVKMLHFAPERAYVRRFARRPNIDYLTADLDPDAAMATMDITAIPRPDATYDVVCANHVLEHVPDDRRAMREIHRVLRPGGWAILQVPMWGETTHEDPTITDPAERERVFGQDNHVRMYGHDGVYRQRLEEAGFDVRVVDYAATLPDDLVTRYRLRSEDVYVCTRPS